MWWDSSVCLQGVKMVSRELDLLFRRMFYKRLVKSFPDTEVAFSQISGKPSAGFQDVFGKGGIR